jgi:hypothetical protein
MCLIFRKFVKELPGPCGLGLFFTAKQQFFQPPKKTVVPALTTPIASPDIRCELSNNDRIHPFCDTGYAFSNNDQIYPFCKGWKVRRKNLKSRTYACSNLGSSTNMGHAP